MLTLHPPAAAPSAETAWIELFNPTDDEIALVQRVTRHHVPSLEDLSAIERSSQLIVDGEELRVSCPVIAGADSDHPSLSHVGLILTPNQLVSVRFAELPTFQATADRACPPGKPPAAVEIFTALLEAFVDRLADHLEHSREHLDEVSRIVFRATPSELKRGPRSNEQLRAMLRRIGRIGERVSLIRDSLLGVGRIATFAQETGRRWIAREFADRLKAVSLDIDSLNLFEEHLSNKVQFLLDAIVGFIGIEQNDIFKVLTVFSIVGIFPTLVAGWYGMNFHNMPEYGWTYGYQFGITVIVLSTVLPLIWFKWRGWW